MSHGHVKPNPDGSKARCGGPGICPVCAIELGMELKIQTLVDDRKKKAMSNEVRRWSAPTEKVEYDPHACVDRVSWADVVLADDYEALKARLAEAEKVIEFYADQSNWGCQNTEEHVSIDQCDWRQTGDFDGRKVFIRGGKRARAYLDKWGSK